MDESGTDPKPPAERPESVVINELKTAYGVSPGSRYDPIFTKIARQEPLTAKEREELELLQKPRKPKATTKLGPEPLPIPTVPGEITSDVTGKIDALRADIQKTAPTPVDLPSFLKKPEQNYEEVKEATLKLLGIEHFTDSVYNTTLEKMYRTHILSQVVTFEPIEETVRDWFIAEFRKKEAEAAAANQPISEQLEAQIEPKKPSHPGVRFFKKFFDKNK